MDIFETFEAFAEGVEYTTDEGWVDPRDIGDADLSIAYHHVINAYREYKKSVSSFDAMLHAKILEQAE